MQTLRRPKIRDQAAEQIKQYIVAQKLVPGDRLPTETQLAARFGISRLSVREATKALEYLGVVESKTGVGLTVRQLDLERMTDHLALHPGLHRVDAQQLIDSRVILETGVLPHVARRMATDPAIRARLQALVDQFPRATDLAAWIDLDIAFHRTLLESSGLEPLVAFGGLLHTFFRRFRQSVENAEWQHSIESHQQILDWLAAGEVAAATAALREHIESHKERFHDIPG
ncbi:MAG: FadR family transcriptional regulator [Planctomycetes bacterium]|nr:FadR family transcriptional regulator [Planctomycetota bacterium]